MQRQLLSFKDVRGKPLSFRRALSRLRSMLGNAYSPTIQEDLISSPEKWAALGLTVDEIPFDRDEIFAEKWEDVKRAKPGAWGLPGLPFKKLPPRKGKRASLRLKRIFSTRLPYRYELTGARVFVGNGRVTVTDSSGQDVIFLFELLSPNGGKV
jgi:hypothetical protein